MDNFWTNLQMFLGGVGGGLVLVIGCAAFLLAMLFLYGAGRGNR